ncbi:MAG: hypothetical protein LAT57_01915 [Balneolales bacterium]|nr:hypothetical protein [Balneolales bacterium]
MAAFLAATKGLANEPNVSTYVFQFTVEMGDEAVNYTGTSELVMTPSSYTITMGVESPSRCVIHMLNFSVAPGPGTYDVKDDENVRTAMLCMFDGTDPEERLASQSGTFTITEIRRDFVKGDFDMILKGPVSGNEFRIHGSVTSENMPLDIQSGNNPFIRN